jgi:hypothetical protein
MSSYEFNRHAALPLIHGSIRPGPSPALIAPRASSVLSHLRTNRFERGIEISENITLSAAKGPEKQKRMLRFASLSTTNFFRGFESFFQGKKGRRRNTRSAGNGASGVGV